MLHQFALPPVRSHALCLFASSAITLRHRADCQSDPARASTALRSPSARRPSAAQSESATSVISSRASSSLKTNSNSRQPSFFASTSRVRCSASSFASGDDRAAEGLIALFRRRRPIHIVFHAQQHRRQPERIRHHADQKLLPVQPQIGIRARARSAAPPASAPCSTAALGPCLQSRPATSESAARVAPESSRSATAHTAPPSCSPASTAKRFALRNAFTVSNATSSGPRPNGVCVRGFMRR